MTELMTFLETYWWLIPLAVMAFCLLASGGGVICCGLRDGQRSDGSALDILDRRYASGKIGSIEYGEKILAMGLGNRR